MTDEEALLAALKGHRAASLDDLLDQLPRDQFKALMAGCGRFIIKVTTADMTRKREREKAKAAP